MNRRNVLTVGISAGILFVTMGVFASNDWFPKTDSMTGKKTGWFGRELPKHATSAWNPFPPPPPTPTLSKEYIYAGSRLLAVEDAKATAAPPADIAVWRPTGGVWYVMGQAGSATTTYPWGISSDTPMPGDYDGDGKTDFAIWRPDDGSWWILYSSTWTYDQFYYGASGDFPVVGDFDGDGKTDLAYGHPDAAEDQMEWYADLSGGGNISGVWGLDTDTPAVADYDGDGKTA